MTRVVSRHPDLGQEIPIPVSMENQFGYLWRLHGLAMHRQYQALRIIVRTADGNRIPRGSQASDRVFTVRERSPADDEIEWHINFHVDGLGRGRSAHQQQAQAEVAFSYNLLVWRR